MVCRSLPLTHTHTVWRVEFVRWCRRQPSFQRQYEYWIHNKNNNNSAVEWTNQKRNDGEESEKRMFSRMHDGGAATHSNPPREYINIFIFMAFSHIPIRNIIVFVDGIFDLLQLVKCVCNGIATLTHTLAPTPLSFFWTETNSPAFYAEQRVYLLKNVHFLARNGRVWTCVWVRKLETNFYVRKMEWRRTAYVAG